MADGKRIVAGAMSGTSADGVDVALVEIEGTGLGMRVRLLHHHAASYAPGLRQKIFAVRQNSQVHLGDLAELGREISLAHVSAVRGALQGARLGAGDLAAVAVHGQTLFHGPPNTIQWIDPALIAAEVGCRVVSDFRRADLAAGGQGAPLVPFADFILFRDATRNRLVINIGGIANFTFLSAGARPEQVVAMDTGPGNCLSDFLMREARSEGPGFDVDGELASRGKAIEVVARKFFENDYFSRADGRAKSTDIPAMIEAFAEARRAAPEASLEDLLATACLVCAEGLWRAAAGMVPGEEAPHLHAGLSGALAENCDLVVSGGGTSNRCIMDQLLRRFFGQQILRTDEFGVPSAAKEALAFALLGAATLDGVASNIPSATGASRAAVLGSITPKP